jgi:hypothetical protein
LRIGPAQGQELYISDFDPRKSEFPLKNMNVSTEFGGMIHMNFVGLDALVHLKDCEELHEDYYGRGLKKSMRLKL